MTSILRGRTDCEAPLSTQEVCADRGRRGRAGAQAARRRRARSARAGRRRRAPGTTRRPPGGRRQGVTGAAAVPPVPSTSAGAEPRQPKRSGAVRIDRTSEAASRSVTGISRCAVSPSSSDAAPASPKESTAPAAGSMTARTTVSTPRGAMLCTTGRSSSGFPKRLVNSAYARRSCSSSARSSRTPPRSARWRRCGAVVLSATGKPRRSAAATASSGVGAGRAWRTSMPYRPSRAQVSSGPRVSPPSPTLAFARAAEPPSPLPSRRSICSAAPFSSMSSYSGTRPGSAASRRHWPYLTASASARTARSAAG